MDPAPGFALMPTTGKRPRATGRLLLAWLALLTFTFDAAAAPVWRVEKDGRVVYLGGTIHVLRDADYPLPAAFERAYAAADRVIFETEIDRLQSEEFRRLVAARLVEPPGRRLRDRVSAQTLRRVQSFFESRGVPFAEVESLNPGLIAITMTMIELRRQGITGTGVDQYYSQRAAADGKARGHLETLAQQVEFIAGLGAGDEDALFAYELADLERLPRLWREISTAWRAGDLDALDAILVETMQAEFAAVGDALIGDRNRAWMPRIEALFDNAETELLLVGALHLAGAEGLIEQLARRGYRVERLE